MESRPPYSFSPVKPSVAGGRKREWAGGVSAHAPPYPTTPALGGLRLPKRQNFFDNLAQMGPPPSSETPYRYPQIRRQRKGACKQKGRFLGVWKSPIGMTES